MLKTLKKVAIIILLMIIYAYFLAYENIPNEIVIFQGEEISVDSKLGFSIEKEETLDASANSIEQLNTKIGTRTAKVNLFDSIFVKTIDVSVLPKTTVIPVGRIAGVKLYTSGVLVVGMSEIEGKDNKKYKPYENSGIEEGDTIIAVDETQISTTDELITNVNRSNGNNVKLKYMHEQETRECSIKPVQTESNEYKLGLWVRDSAARSRNCNIL